MIAKRKEHQMIKYDLNKSKTITKMLGKRRWAAIRSAINTMPKCADGLPAEVVKILGDSFDVHISHIKEDLRIPLTTIQIGKSGKPGSWSCLLRFTEGIPK